MKTAHFFVWHLCVLYCAFGVSQNQNRTPFYSENYGNAMNVS